MKTPARRTTTLALLLLATLPVFARDAAGPQKPIAVQMYTLRDAGPLDQQLLVLGEEGVRALIQPHRRPRVAEPLLHARPALPQLRGRGSKRQ